MSAWDRRIIDRDIEFYESVVQQTEANIRRCPPAEEAKLKEIQAKNIAVVEALLDLRATIDEKQV